MSTKMEQLKSMDIFVMMKERGCGELRVGRQQRDKVSKNAAGVSKS